MVAKVFDRVDRRVVALLLVVHAQLWFGRGSVRSVSALERQLEAQKAANAQGGGKFRPNMFGMR